MKQKILTAAIMRVLWDWYVEGIMKAQKVKVLTEVN